MRKRIASALRVAVGLFDLRDLILAVGLGLMAAGFAEIWRPLAFIVPGAVLVYLALFGNRPTTGD